MFGKKKKGEIGDLTNFDRDRYKPEHFYEGIVNPEVYRKFKNKKKPKKDAFGYDYVEPTEDITQIAATANRNRNLDEPYGYDNLDVQQSTSVPESGNPYSVYAPQSSIYQSGPAYTPTSGVVPIHIPRIGNRKNETYNVQEDVVTAWEAPVDTHSEDRFFASSEYRWQDGNGWCTKKRLLIITGVVSIIVILAVIGIVLGVVLSNKDKSTTTSTTTSSTSSSASSTSSTTTVTTTTTQPQKRIRIAIAFNIGHNGPSRYRRAADGVNDDKIKETIKNTVERYKDDQTVAFKLAAYAADANFTDDMSCNEALIMVDSEYNKTKTEDPSQTKVIEAYNTFLRSRSETNDSFVLFSPRKEDYSEESMFDKDMNDSRTELENIQNKEAVIIVGSADVVKVFNVSSGWIAIDSDMNNASEIINEHLRVFTYQQFLKCLIGGVYC